MQFMVLEAARVDMERPDACTGMRKGGNWIELVRKTMMSH
jgi:hypothetical protein